MMTTPYRSPARLLVSLLLWLGLAAPLTAPALAGTVEPIDRILVILNDDVITETELLAELEQTRRLLRARRIAMPSEAVLARQVLEKLIETRLQLQLAAKTGIRVDDDSLNRALRNSARQNGLTLDGLRQALERDGFSFARFREKMRNDIILKRLQQREVAGRVTVTEQEVAYALANRSLNQGEYLLRHILISLPEGATPEQIQQARTRAEAILERLRQGADFTETAIAESQGGDALEGGSLGWRKLEQMPGLFADAVREMKPGQISGLLRSPSGFHILKVEDYTEGNRHIVHQTLARHILIQPDELTSAEAARKTLEELRQRIRDGEDFAELAKTHSADKASAVDGGMLNWASPGDLVPAFEKVMNRLDIGEISEPFETRFGWHIVQVLERRDHDDTEAFLRAQARKAILQRKITEEKELWLRRLRDESYIKYLLET